MGDEDAGSALSKTMTATPPCSARVKTASSSLVIVASTRLTGGLSNVPRTSGNPAGAASGAPWAPEQPCGPAGALRGGTGADASGARPAPRHTLVRTRSMSLASDFLSASRLRVTTWMVHRRSSTVNAVIIELSTSSEPAVFGEPMLSVTEW